MGSAHQLHVVHPREVPPHTVVPLLVGAGGVFPVQVPPLASLRPPGFELPKQPAPVAKPGPVRCGEKGCIFPALAGGGGKCLHHTRQELEPSMFHSKQPTSAAIEQGKFVELGNERIFGSREADRRRFDAERETFLES